MIGTAALPDEGSERAARATAAQADAFRDFLALVEGKFRMYLAIEDASLDDFLADARDAVRAPMPHAFARRRVAEHFHTFRVGAQSGGTDPHRTLNSADQISAPLY